ncbi:hypothetical protein JL720_5560 [Aureococcus anophagefferens]|nr:hypothetical protein JL720_5560 [Aureococcus anophagefferens]
MSDVARFRAAPPTLGAARATADDVAGDRHGGPVDGHVQDRAAGESCTARMAPAWRAPSRRLRRRPDAAAAAPAHWLHRYRDRNLTTPSCFVVTLRDPAARVHSSINNCRKGENCFKKNLHWCREFAAWNWTADAVAAAYFDEADPGHATVNARTCWGLDISTAQKYLGGLDCATAEVHYVCTDRLLEDFAALLSDDVAAWLRADVFPDDAALHAAYCGG